jgi:hypothetical protein
MPEHLISSQFTNSKSKLQINTSSCGVHEALRRQVLEWTEEFRKFPMLQRKRLMHEVFKPDGLLTWWVVHLATGADHLYQIRLPAAGSCLLYDNIGQNSNGSTSFKFDWTKKLVDNYIEDAYLLLSMPRPSDPDNRKPSEDLLVLEYFWRRYYQNSVSFVVCTEIEQLVRFF